MNSSSVCVCFVTFWTIYIVFGTIALSKRQNLNVINQTLNEFEQFNSLRETFKQKEFVILRVHKLVSDTKCGTQLTIFGQTWKLEYVRQFGEFAVFRKEYLGDGRKCRKCFVCKNTRKETIAKFGFERRKRDVKFQQKVLIYVFN